MSDNYMDSFFDKLEAEKIEIGGLLWRCLQPNAIPPVEVKCSSDRFENEIRKFGVANACEWFGHDISSKFTIDTIKVLLERSEKQNVG